MRIGLVFRLVFTVTSIGLLQSIAQVDDIRFRRLSIREGLSQVTVTAIAQDSTGFLWFATQDGLNRYDGYAFRVFSHDAADSTTLSDNFIWCLCVARNGMIWIGTLAGGLNRYDQWTDTFAAYRYDPLRPGGITSDNVVCLHEDAGGTLWIGTWGGGLCRMDSSGTLLSSYRHDPAHPSSLSHDRVADVLEDAEGDLWVATWGGGVCRLRKEDSSAGVFLHYTHRDRDETSIGSNLVWTIHEDRMKRLWFGTVDGGLSLYNRETDDFTTYRPTPGKSSIGDNRICSIQGDRAGRLWVGTWSGGLAAFDAEREVFSHYTHDPADPQTIGRGAVNAICEDNSGGLWFGTWSGGVSSYDIHRQKFPLYKHSPNDPGSLAGGGVTALWQDADGGLWVGVDGGGIDYLSPGRRAFVHLGERVTPRGMSGTFEVSCFSGRDREALWIGTSYHGLIRLDRRTGKTTQYLHDPRNPASIGENTIMALLEDSEGGLWIGTATAGLDRMDKKTGRCVHFKSVPADSLTLSGDWIWSLFEDRGGAFWIGTWGAGLNRYDRTTGNFTRFRNRPEDRESLSGNSVLCIAEDMDGHLWVGSHGGGVSAFDASARRFRSFGKRDGLGSDVVYGILPDRHGRLWLSTNKGVTRFEPRTGQCKNYDASDGLQSEEFSQNCFFLGRDGKMFMGGIEGLNAFHPDSIRDNMSLPTAVVTGFTVLEEPRGLHPDPTSGMSVALDPSQNFFSFEFAGLSYAAPEKNQYAYKLEGFDENWISCGSRRYAAYTNLDGGEYTFLVRASNNDGRWNDIPASVRIHLGSPYWKTFWFRFLAGGLLLAAGFLFVKSRMDSLRRERDLQHEFSRRLNQLQDGERKRIATALHDSLGQDLLIVKNGLHLVIKNLTPGPPAQQELQQLQDVVQQAIEETREISFDLHPHTLDSLGLGKAIDSVARKCEHTSGIRFQVESGAIDDVLPPGETINLFRLVQEALNNVVKHSDATTCTLVIKRRGDMLEIAVQDDGKGFDVASTMNSASEYKGIGLRSMAERVNFLKGDMSVHSVPGTGTVITLNIPLPGAPQQRG